MEEVEEGCIYLYAQPYHSKYEQKVLSKSRLIDEISLIWKHNIYVLETIIRLKKYYYLYIMVQNVELDSDL